jgi:hypothetical protein
MIKKRRKKSLTKSSFKIISNFYGKKLFLFHLKGDNRKVQLKALEFAKHVITSNLFIRDSFCDQYSDLCTLKRISRA